MASICADLCVDNGFLHMCQVVSCGLSWKICDRFYFFLINILMSLVALIRWRLMCICVGYAEIVVDVRYL